jgi:hypothetical protein
MRISTRLLITVGTLFLAAGLLVVVLVNHHMRQQALLEAEEKADILLDHNLATHTYFTHRLKPTLFELTEPFRSADYFEPTWMSSTYAVRAIHEYFTPLHNEVYYYKECAINARSIANEADPFEQGFIRELNEDPTLEKRSAIRRLDGKPYLVVLHRGESMAPSCLRCHSEPEKAPGGLIETYGPERSFHRKEGEVLSAISMRIPLAAAYAHANVTSLRLSALLLALLVFLFVVLFWLNRRLLFEPLSMIRIKALQISTSEAHLGDIIPLPEGRELNQLATAFNAMSVKLRENMDQLEERVKSRTKELVRANDKLTEEIEQRKKIEEEKETLIGELQEALVQVKTLKGLFPICASCKKIRDDKGYWNQIEAYLKDHSEAEFSHSICPDCLTKLYPGM